MRILVLLLSIAMPTVAWFSNQQAFGPDNGTMADRYPTLLAAAGYAFAIWGLIFLLDIAHGVWQLRERGPATTRGRVWVAAGFALTAAWMPVFSQGLFWLALLIIWTALACLLAASFGQSRSIPSPGARVFGWLPLSLHAGWLSVAAFLNTAQVVVAYQWLDTTSMLGWSLPLLIAAVGLLLAANAAFRGNLPYVAAAIWGLAAVHVKQSGWALPGSDTIAWAAVAAALLVALQWGRLAYRHRGSER